MVSANALHFGNAKSMSMLRVFPDEHPVSLQLFGADPDRLAEAAQRVPQITGLMEATQFLTPAHPLAAVAAER
jgi:tRNA-dihydrouridine synthase